MPGFDNQLTGYTVSDYCGRMLRKELVINREYQRQDSVWPPAARSFLIESILLGYPIPKLSIRERTDLKTRTVIGEIIDGQQRSKAILDFYENKFAISRRSEIVEARGKTFEGLPDDLQQQFITFRLTADVFTGASNEEIRELFRRINSYTVALNPEELRHAKYQGAMKWFIYEQGRAYSPYLESTRVLNEKSLARMGDAKLFADLTLAYLQGIRTTKAKELNDLYKTYEDEFKAEDTVAKAFKSGFQFLEKMPDLVGTALYKQHNFYTLLLAIIHAKNAVDSLAGEVEGGMGLRSPDDAQSRLLKLDDILDSETPPKKYQAFYQAASEKTNTRESRLVRFKTFLEAVAKE